jgi:hypothetical protein
MYVHLHSFDSIRPELLFITFSIVVSGLVVAQLFTRMRATIQIRIFFLLFLPETLQKSKFYFFIQLMRSVVSHVRGRTQTNCAHVRVLRGVFGTKGKDARGGYKYLHA